jgi:hypothetical protein
MQRQSYDSNLENITKGFMCLRTVMESIVDIDALFRFAALRI